MADPPDLRTLAAAFYAGLNSGDVDAVASLCDADISWTRPEYDGGVAGGVFQGPTAVRDGVLTALHAAIDGFRAEPTATTVEGDRIVVQGRESGYLRSTGGLLDVPFVHVLEFRGDRLRRFEHYTATAAAPRVTHG